jgi:hypothetical protein
MPEAISLGPLSISGLVLTAALSGGAGMLILYAWVKQAPAMRSGPWFELMATTVPIVVLCWKFGILWRDPSLLWERPGLVLMMTGGGVEAAAGCVLALVYWFMAVKKRKLSLWLAADALAVASAGGIAAWCLLSAPAHRWGYAIVCAAVLIQLFRLRGEEREASGRAAIAFCSGVGAGALAVSLFLPPPPFAPPIEWLGLPERQWLMIGTGLLGVLLQASKERTG